MASPTTSVAPRKTWHGGSKRRRVLAFLIIAAAVVGLVLALFPRVWPFTRKSILENLGEATDSTVTPQDYRATFFPPGCVLNGVTFLHHGSRFITIQKLIVTGSYPGILRRHVPHIEAVGAHIYIPAIGSNAKFQSQHSNIVVDELIANGAYVEFESTQPKNNPFHFDVHEATLRDVRWLGAILYHLKFHNPNPPGEISADGKFGSWSEGHAQDTPFSGRYTFDHADLAYYGGIAGLLSSVGQFDGSLKHLNVSGSTVIPDFEIQSSGNRVKLETRFHAYVDAMNGDTFLQRVEAHFGHTGLIVEGDIAHRSGTKGKFANLRFSARNGRIEDVLGLFVKGPSPMKGAVSLHADTTLPPDGDEFRKRVQLAGDFHIDEGHFSKEETQHDVDALSAGARGKSKEDPPIVLTNLSGQVKLQQGTADFAQLSFAMPGATAGMHGTYSILNYRINLHGHMRVDTSISKTSSGVKSVLLKILDPLFEKRKKGEVVPIYIEGTYEKPKFGLDLANGKSPKK